METNAAKSGQITQAVFSVCVPNEVASGLIDAVAAVPGAEFIGQFQEYITAEKRPQFPDVMKEAAGCVALVGCDQNPDLAHATMDRLRQAFPQKLSLIAVSSKTDTEFLLRTMRAGCDDFLTPPIDPELLQAALKRFQKGYLTQTVSARGDGKVIALYGAKGGVGTTTMAVHLAMHLVRRHHKKVLLIDHKHELGHVALHLGIKESVYHFDELLRNVDRLDSDLLDGFVTRHSSGLDVIPSPDSCGPLPETPHEAIGRVMDDLRTRYDYILVDSSLQYVPQLASMMEACDEVALVCTPDVAALRDLVRRIEHLSAVTGFTTKLRVVINRSTSDDAVSSSDIEAAVRFPISVAVPNNYADLMRAINAGEPVSPQHRGGFTQAIAQWSNRLASNHPSKTTSTVAEPKRRFLFGF
jgi:pilus assembly protein CpaE